MAVQGGNVTHRVENLAWYPFGPRTHATFPPANAVTSDRAINLRGQVERILVQGPGAVSFLDRQYAYDYRDGAPGPSDAGPNLDRVVDAVDPTESRFFFYDPLDRLEKATDLAGNVLFQYGYDAVGNRTSQGGMTGAAAYGYETGTDRLDAATDPGTQAPLRDFAHDAYGNRIYDGAAAYAGTPSLLYDDANRLVEVRDPANGFATLATYTYDAFGRRVKKVTPTKTIVFFYDTEGHLIQEVEKKESAADLARSYVFLEDDLLGVVDAVKEVGTASLWSALSMRLPNLQPPGWVLVVVLLGSGTLLLLARRHPAGATAAVSAALATFVCAGTQRPPPTFRFVHVDPLGSPLAVTSTPGNAATTAVVWRARYEPFGRAIVQEDPDGDGAAFTFNVRFPGQREDAETEWHYNLRRTYDPGTGRYLETDPIGQAGGLNLFGYVENKPTMNSDPTGLQATPMGVVLPSSSATAVTHRCQSHGRFRRRSPSRHG